MSCDPAKPVGRPKKDIRAERTVAFRVECSVAKALEHRARRLRLTVSEMLRQHFTDMFLAQKH